MKNIQRILAIALLITFAACEETNPDVLVGGDGDANLSGRQYANIDPPVSIPFVYQGTTSLTIDLGRFESEGSTIESVEITKQLFIDDLDNDDDTVISAQSAPVVIIVTGAELMLVQTLAGLFADVPVEGNILDEEDLDPKDLWTYSYVVNISGEAPTSDNKLTVATVTTIPYSCVSAIPTDGTWAGVTTQGAFGVFGANAGVTLTAVDASGNYEMSDITAGFYDNFGFPINQAGNINDLCNIITVTGAPDANFNLGASVTNGGFWDATTSTLTVTWYDSGNDIDEISIYNPE